MTKAMSDDSSKHNTMSIRASGRMKMLWSLISTNGYLLGNFTNLKLIYGPAGGIAGEHVVDLWVQSDLLAANEYATINMRVFGTEPLDEGKGWVLLAV